MKFNLEFSHWKKPKSLHIVKMYKKYIVTFYLIGENILYMKTKSRLGFRF